jgi:hypothetical protein
MTDRDEYQPREEGTLTVTARDNQGASQRRTLWSG